MMRTAMKVFGSACSCLLLLTATLTETSAQCFCWDDNDCAASPSCDGSCITVWWAGGRRCSITLPPPQPPTAPPTTPPPTFSPSGPLIPQQCDLQRLIDAMDTSVRRNKAIAPQWLRLAFHDAGTFHQGRNEGGANGCLLNHPPMRDADENHNLHLATETLRFAQDISGMRGLSAADLIQFAGFFTVVRQRGSPGLNQQKRFELLNNFRWGRPDERNCQTSWTDNLPGFQLDADPTDIRMRCLASGAEIKRKMMDRNGFTAEEATALIGAHTIGLTRNVFGAADSAPWTTNGADEATGEGPVFDNGFHRFLIDDIQAKTVDDFASNRLMFDEDFSNWFRDNTNVLNHLDTDVALAFPSQDIAEHPHFFYFTHGFADVNEHFIETFMRSLDKMSKLGVSATLQPAPGCFFAPPPPSVAQPAPPPTVSEDMFNAELDASIAAAEEKLRETAREREEEIALLTTPININ